ncbi:hypothetical protein ACFSQP_03615 [Bizionia sediminis]|uniref:Uncharacterized protein n=1 Tax=Bizionia sediminis TaxID=1737064 RepID=A0ABW5KPY6_9FLAO
MKTLIYMSLFMCSGFLLAQEDDRDKQKETTTKTVTINNGEKTIENKVKITTTKSANVKLAESDKHKINQKRLDATNTKISKTIALDVDNDPFYDSKIKMVRLKQNGKIYNFVKSTSGFQVMDAATNTKFGTAKSSNEAGRYQFKTAHYTGIGYFNSSGDFVIEYYDKASNRLLTRTFILENK